MKKTRTKWLCYFLLVSVLAGGAFASLPAQRININRDWKFVIGNPEDKPYLPDYNDAGWERIGLPHSFSLPYFRSKDFYVGYGWYRKTIEKQPDWKGKQIYIDFDGVFQESDVYLNGRYVGKHQGGYIGFTMDITPFLKEGKNVLAVQVNNLWNPRLAPRAGEHVFAGGIYRDVCLRVANPVHVAWNGTFVTTPSVSEEEGTVQIVTEISNTSTKDVSCQISQTILDAKGNRVNSFTKDAVLKGSSVQSITQQSGKILSPKLWSPEQPSLYAVETILKVGGKVTDTYTTPFGFRWMKWSKDEGFFLNGKHYYMQGTNVHQDHAGWGDAITRAGVYRDVKMMKDAGFNMIRGSHYPHHPYFAQVCDELGMLFISENNVWGIGGHKEDGYWDSSIYPTQEADQPEYERTARHSLVEMIRINRNHPSIVAWSMCNEPFFTYPNLMEKVKAMLVSLVALSHEADPSRVAIIGGAQRGEIDILGDVAGYNGDGATLFRNPGIPNLVSEYGSCVSDRPGDYDPCWGNVTDGEEPAWRAGHAIWCGFDHGSIAGDMGKMGIVDFFRIPKRGWYWYRNQNLGIAPPAWPKEGIPARLKLTTDKTVLQGTDGTDDALLLVTVTDKNGVAISNSPVVKLSIISGPGEFPTGRHITFKPTTADDIRIQDGQAAIEFRSYEGGRTLIRATSEGLEDATLEIDTRGIPLYVEGVTPICADRVYNPDSVFHQTEQQVVNVSHKRPTQASSVASGIRASFANDGDGTTFWAPALSDTHPWWNLDMENFYQIKEVRIQVPESSVTSYIIELSADNKNWVKVSEGNMNGKNKPDLIIPCNHPMKARFIRAVFNNNKIAIREIEVQGL